MNSSANPVKVGVIGTGSIAQAHLGAYAANPRATVVAIADHSPQRAAENAAKWGAAASYGSATELLASPEVEAVSICTWNNTHAALAIEALQAGKHVLLEKPMSRTYTEAVEVLAVAQASDRVMQVGFVRRHSTNAQWLKSVIDAGDLGEIYYAKTSVIRRAGNPGGWFADVARSGGGPLLDIGVHMLDLAWYMMGAPRAVAVSGNTYARLGNRDNVKFMSRYKAADYDPAHNDVEDVANAMIRFENGASLMLDASYSLHATEDSLRLSLFGDRGGADLEPQARVATELHDTIVNIEPQIAHRSFDFEEGFAAEIENFLGAVRGKNTVLAPPAHGAEIMKIIDGIYESARQGVEVRL